MPGSLFAISDLHSSYSENRRIIDEMRPESSDDWLIVAGDVDYTFSKIEKTLSLLQRRYAKVIWTPVCGALPGSCRNVPTQRHSPARGRVCDLARPERSCNNWLAPGTRNKKESLAYAYETGIVCADEMLLHPAPYPDRESWCSARLKEAERRLLALGPDVKTVLVGHWPLVRQPTQALRFPEFAQWCGTTQTSDWHIRFRAKVVVYGHLHIPRTTYYDGVRFEEVSVGYPREWSKRSKPPRPKKVLPI